MTAQDLTRLNRDSIGEIREMHPLPTPKLTNVTVTIYHAVRDYIAGWVRKQRTVTVAKCGKISHRNKLFIWLTVTILRFSGGLLRRSVGRILYSFKASAGV